VYGWNPDGKIANMLPCKKISRIWSEPLTNQGNLKNSCKDIAHSSSYTTDLDTVTLEKKSILLYTL
jgi:hypothetical protein